MKYLIFLVVMVSGPLLFSIIINQRDTSTTTEDARPSDPVVESKVPVVVELFTSEGCSSCPPADEALARLDKAQPVPGVEIIALSEHVDYWNRLGWTDPYSSASNSARQGEYARAFGSDNLYTPQMVVDGREEFVGSNFDKALNAIAGAARSPKASVQLSVDNLADAKSERVKLKLRVDSLPAIEEGEVAEVLLAITESHLKSSVTRGENSGRKLAHTAVVRKLDVIGQVSSKSGGAFDFESRIDMMQGWKRSDLRAVVFVQERRSRRILGASSIGLAAQ